ncbi:MAG: hypothetical protein AAF518_07210 [Spirochaetota bacterium]
MKNKKNIFLRLFSRQGIDSPSMKEQVRGVLLELLPNGIAYTGTVAAKLGVSEQTVLDELEEENCTFQEVLEEARKTLAINYIQQDYRLEEIVCLLGYTNTRALISIFKERLL